MASWFDGIKVGQTISIKYNVHKSGPVCLHVYDVNNATVLAETNMNATAGNDREFVIEIDQAFLSSLSTEKIMIGGSGATITNVSLHL